MNLHVLLELTKWTRVMKNKIPILDKGYIAFIDSTLSGEVLTPLEIERYNGKINESLLDIASLTIEIRCPVFIQLFLQSYQLRILTTNNTTVEYYLPDVGDIGAPDLQVCTDVVAHIAQTIEALTLTAAGFKQDGVDNFISQLLTPISVYNTIIVSGSLNEWIKVAFTARRAPHMIAAYIDVIQSILRAEWPELQTYIDARRSRDKQGRQKNKKDIPLKTTS